MAHLREIPVDGHRMAALAYNEDKSGTPVIFIHGIASSPYFFDVVQSPVIHERRWYAVTLPGHGPAGFPAGFSAEQLTPELIVEVTMKTINALVGEQPFILAGYSTGGFTALAVAAHAPEGLKAVISIAGFAQGTWRGSLGMYQKLARWGVPGRALFSLGLRSSQTLGKPYFRMAWSTYVADKKAFFAYPNFDHVVDVLYPMGRHLSPKAMQPWFEKMPKTDISDRLAKISVPVYVIAGDKDPIVPPAQARLIAEKTGGTLKMLNGAGHMLMMERQAEYDATLKEWFEHIG